MRHNNKTNAMKIQAKDLKVGMTIKNGHYVMVIDSIELSNQKNGTPTVIVYGVAQYTKKNIYGKYKEPSRIDFVFKYLTFVNAI
jgi:hypothetical protein